MMHCDYQLAYCFIMYILVLIYVDRTFKKKRLTSEYIFRLRVSSRLHTFFILWKNKMLQTLIL